MKKNYTLAFLFVILLGYFTYAQCSGAQFEEQSGIVVIQAESGNISSSWNRETSKSGYTGSSYIIWRGSQFFGTPGNGIIEYKVRINTPGKYRFAWRNTIGIIADSKPTTEHNDSWLKFPDASDFYGEKGGSRIYPRGSGKSPNPNGASSGGWFKVFVNVLDWSWNTVTSDFDGHPIFAEFDSPGVYTIQISARSSGHLIDRMVLYNVNSYSFSSATSLSRGETECGSGGGGTPPPPPPPPPPSGDNNPPTVSITSPADGANVSTGSNVTINLTSGDSDGSVVKHEIFVNGSKVDTDGSGYSPYTIMNIASGSYEIRAKVTDNSGASAESTVNITAGGGGGSPPPPPPPPPPSGDNNPPTVSITNPADGQNFAPGSSVPVNLTADDSDGSVVKHEIFVNGSKVDTDGSNYTPHTIANMAAGSYSIRALVTDNDGATAETTVNITVGGGGGSPPPPPPPPPPTGGNDAPSVSIVSPTNGQNFSPGSNVVVNINASDSDGSVVKHEIFVNGTKVDTDGSNFTPHTIRNISSGNYTIRALVTDNDGATAEATVSITVGGGGGSPPPPPTPAGNISLTLVDGVTDTDITALFTGAVINNGSGINIRAFATHEGASSIRFNLTGPTSLLRTENFAPYAMFGDSGGDYVAGNLSSGSYRLTTAIFSGPNASGSIIGSRTIDFTVNGGSGKSINAYVYPNPVKGERFSVKIESETPQGEVFFRLIDTSGAEIESGKVNVNGDAAEFSLRAFNNRNNGVYYLMLQSSGGAYTVPIIKE